MMKDALAFSELRLNAWPSPILFATDARGPRDGDSGGFGIVGLETSVEVIKQVYEEAYQLGYTVPRVDGDIRELERPERILRRTTPHTRLPEEIFKAEEWKEIDWGTWASTDHINLGESRTVVRLARRLASSAIWHGAMVLSLQDNMATAGCFTKGRSPAFPLLRLLRQRAAATVASDLRLALPWVETIKQTADKLSRDARPAIRGPRQISKPCSRHASEVPKGGEGVPNIPY